MTSSTVCFRRTNPQASPAALVAAWLLDALTSADGVRLTCSDSDLIMLDVIPFDIGTSVHDLVDRVLAEPRFAGWQVLVDDTVIAAPDNEA